MSITKITAQQLRTMKDKQGLVLQGCGGDLDQWVNGINDMLTEDGILQDGNRIENCYVFEHDGLTCLLFPLEDAKADMGKLAIWRIKNNERFNCMWLTDFVDQRLGGYVSEAPARKKPNCALIGQDGNIFNLMGIASRTLRQHGMRDEATEMCDRIRHSGSYDKALCIIGEYVNITSTDDDGDMDEGLEMGYDNDEKGMGME